MKKILVALLVAAFMAINVFGDIARPDVPKQTTKKTKGIDSGMTIRLDRGATEARLVIPKNRLKQIRAELEQLDDDSGDTATAALSFTKTQTIVSGLFLSLAAVFGGVWLSRGRGRTPETKTGKKIVGGAAILCLLSAAAATTFVFANAGPPSELRSINGKLFDKKVFSGWNSAYGKIRIEVSDSANSIELIVPDKAEEGSSAGE